MNININSLKTQLINTTVKKPISGTLSGHAAGEPFDKHVFKFVSLKYPNKTFRQFEYLNKLYNDNPGCLSYQQRHLLIKNISLAYLLSRGKIATKNWSTNSQFEEKQNDTADIIVVNNDFFNIIDVKTFNTSKKGQPPNIISSYKLANMCALMLSKKNFDSHSIIYIGVDWQLDKTNLKCSDVSIKELFKTNPSNLYINWAAAMQIQFHVGSLSQDFKGNVEKWCKDYLRMFVTNAKSRSDKMIIQFVKPFIKFLK